MPRIDVIRISDLSTDVKQAKGKAADELKFHSDRDFNIPPTVGLDMI